MRNETTVPLTSTVSKLGLSNFRPSFSSRKGSWYNLAAYLSDVVEAASEPVRPNPYPCVEVS